MQMSLLVIWKGHCNNFAPSNTIISFLSDPDKPGVRSTGPDVSPRGCANSTDVTLADEDSNSIPTDDVNRAIIGNVAMQMAPPVGQTCN